MIRSLLVGLAAGARSLTPLALVSEAAGRGRLPDAPAWLGRPGVRRTVKLLAAAELYGDKLRHAPDRIVPAGLAARIIAGGLAGGALAPRGRAALGALAGAGAAVGAAYLTFHARQRAMAAFGQRSTGLVEDALTAGVAWLAVFSRTA